MISKDKNDKKNRLIQKIKEYIDINLLDIESITDPCISHPGGFFPYPPFPGCAASIDKVHIIKNK